MSEHGEQAYEGPAIIEIMGHVKVAGYVRQVEMYGASLLRVDVPAPDGTVVATPLFGGGAIYCVTPCSEATLRDAMEQTYAFPRLVQLALETHQARKAPQLPGLSVVGEGAGEEMLEDEIAEGLGGISCEDDEEYEQELDDDAAEGLGDRPF